MFCNMSIMRAWKEISDEGPLACEQALWDSDVWHCYAYVIWQSGDLDWALSHACTNVEPIQGINYFSRPSYPCLPSLHRETVVTLCRQTPIWQFASASGNSSEKREVTGQGCTMASSQLYWEHTGILSSAWRYRSTNHNTVIRFHNMPMSRQCIIPYRTPVRVRLISCNLSAEHDM